MAPRTVVALSRQLGSGGSQVGQQIASRLGFRYADREILRQAAEALGTNEEELAGQEERICPLWERLLCVFSPAGPDAAYIPPPPGPPSDARIFTAESEIIRGIADREDCVIVGRGAGYVLRDHPGVVRVLLHAPVEFRIRRVMEVYGVATPDEARSMVEQSDRAREQFRKQMTGADGLRATNYHLCLDTSSIPLPEVTDLAVDLVRRMRKAARAESGG
ncbi:MAG TPA: cytidylate kinase-like family protein [Armatimonadota bacterium]